MSAKFDYLLESLRSRVYEIARKTPLERSDRLSEEIGNHAWLKREDLQLTYSFKLRGAYNCIANRLAAKGGAKLRRALTASAGNHAQGVALSAARLGLSSTIVMPVTTPEIKIEAVERLGGTALLHGNDYDSAYAHAQLLAAKSKSTIFVHPYDDPWVISGQGTIALEIISQHPGEIEAIFVPVGGGGLIAGICACVRRIHPSIRIIGVEPDEACALQRSLKANKRVKLSNVGLFVDGVAVRQVGARAWGIVKDCLDGVITVSDDEICNTIEWLFKDTRSVVEPAGALAVAGMRKFSQQRPKLRNKHLVSIVSGANINFNKLRYVSERVEYSTGEEKLLAITIPERPGSFKRLARLLMRHNITEFNYRDNGTEQAHVFCGVNFSGKGRQDYAALIAKLDKGGYALADMTGNDLAKTHIRYTVGGRLPQAKNEHLLRMEFDERPGALLRFLESLPPKWSISLFHYRNHGSATGQILCGLSIGDDRRSPVSVLKRLGYLVFDETGNTAYKLFLR